MTPRGSLQTVIVVAILLLASSDAAFFAERNPTLHNIGVMQYDAVDSNLQVGRKDEYFDGTPHGFTQTNSIKQEDLDKTDESETNPADDTINGTGKGATDLIPEVGMDDEVGNSEGDESSGDSSTTDDGGATENSEGGEDSGESPSKDDSGASSSDSNSEPPVEKSDEDKTGTSDGDVQGNVTSTLAGGEQSSGNQTDPFDAFMLMQMVEVTSGDAFEQVTVYEHGSFVGPFANAPNTSTADGFSVPNDESWYTDSEYADRIAFQFTYTPGSKDYTISEPLVNAGSSRGVLPIVQDFKDDASTGGGSFTVLYRCQPDAPQTFHIALKLQVTADRAIETMWKKKCGSGRFEHLEFGFKAHDGLVTLFNADGTYGTHEQRTLEVGPLETSTELTLKLASPAQNLQFMDPYVSSDSDEVSVRLRGTIKGGTLSGDRETSFSILYECKSATTAAIGFTVEIPPWDNVTAQWRKDCGGSRSEALLIGTKGKGSFDVMQAGELSSRYNVTDKTSLDDAWGVVEVVPAKVDTKRFDITNSDDTSEIHIQTITTTMASPDVVTTVVSAPMLGTRSYIPSTGDVIKRHESKSLSLHFMCKREGKSLVLVTLPTLRYKNVEFGFIKECYEPKAYHHSGFLQTASSLMAAFLVIIVMAAIGTCIYLRRRQDTKYTAVPTNDSVIP